jgi:stage V sporulation protein D (sporulation-specific penicillin-binding protein)
MRASFITTRRRLVIAVFIGTLVFLSLIGRLGYVQIVAGNELSSKARDSWTRTVPFEAKRGMILDRNGEVLAYNISSPSVFAIPVQIGDKPETARQLAGVLKYSEDKILAMISRQERIIGIQPGGRKISEEKADEIRKLELKGIYVAEDNKRHYPYGPFLSHVLGFSGGYNQGLTGLELYYDELLKGKRGYISYSSTASGKEMPNTPEGYIQPHDGLNLVLTIDKNIQSFIERELDLAMIKYEPKSVIAIAMDPNTGEVLGMASRPHFNPEEYQSSAPEVYNRNLPIWMTYEPGSTFKIITLAASLEENKVNLKAGFHDPGYIMVDGARLRCWKHGGHGSQTFLEVVENSCNPGFVAMGQRLGKEKLFEYIKKFGFGQKTGIDMAGEENGILFKMNQVGPVELATTAFGQGVSVTPIQQISAVAAAINGGKLYRPHVAKEWLDPTTNSVVERIKPELIREVISQETSEKVRMSLESVVANGTGRNAYVEGYRVGGKTGTAQKVGPNGRYMANEHIVSFIGFAPADDPKIVVYLAIDNPKGIQFGGIVTAPIVGKILEDSLRYMDVKPRKDQMEKKLRAYQDIPTVEVPMLVGESIDRIRQTHYAHFSLVTSGAGKYVAAQAPRAGAKIQQGSAIRVYLTDKEPVNELK